MGALAMSEVGSGSDVVSMRLRADKKGERKLIAFFIASKICGFPKHAVNKPYFYSTVILSTKMKMCTDIIVPKTLEGI